MRTQDRVMRIFVLLVLNLSTLFGTSAWGATSIDVLVLYDNSAGTWVTSNSSSQQIFAADAINRMNQATSNSGMALDFNLTSVRQVSYTYNPAATDLCSLLNSLQAGTGAFSSVDSWRNTDGADLVTLLVDTGSATGTVGCGFEPGNQFAYSTLAVQAVDQTDTMTHEIGHNLGAGHSKYQAIDPGPSPTSSSAAGWYFTGTDHNDYHSIMAYNNDGYENFYLAAPLFSTPYITYKGVPAGDINDGYNVAAVESVMNSVAAYRASLTTLQAPVLGAIADQEVNRGTPSANILFSVSDADTPLSSLQLSASSSNSSLVAASGLSFSGNSSQRSLTIVPQFGLTGSTTISVSLSDGSLSDSTSFIFRVVAPLFQVTPLSSTGGSLDPARPQTVTSGDQFSFRVLLAPGHHIEQISGCNGSLAADMYSTGIILADCSVSARFAINTYTLSYRATTGGTLLGTTTQSINYGQDAASITAVAADGYHFVGWSDGRLTPTRFDTDIRQDLSLIASFAQNLDSDQDGIPDHWESLFGLNPSLPNTAGQDSDHDGFSDYHEYLLGLDPLVDNRFDLDTDNDGLSDKIEVSFGLDLDSADASSDPDQDGFSNLTEIALGTSPTTDNESLPDTDADGIPDTSEILAGLDPTLADAIDDQDGDGLINLVEYLNGTLAINNAKLTDSDNDSLPDIYEQAWGLDPDNANGLFDSDSDGLEDLYEYQFGLDPWVDNRHAADTDNDGISDQIEMIFGLNPDDATDALEDPDHDGLPSLLEIIYGTSPVINNIILADTDRDGLPDLVETLAGTDPAEDNSNFDSDDDGIMDLREYHYGTLGTPNHLIADQDQDSLPDIWELLSGLDPESSNMGADTDNDGISDADEYLLGTDPLDFDRDSDNDGVENQHDNFPLNSNLIANGDTNGNGIIETTDALAALQLALNPAAQNVDNLKYADVTPVINGLPQPDGKITIADALAILHKAIGLVND